MSKCLKNILKYWLPPLLLMGLIFYLSSEKRPPLVDEPFLNFLVYKAIHMSVFGTLYALWFRALYKGTRLKIADIYIYALIISIFYAVSDEYHQTFIDGRDGNPFDVGVDTLGISLVYFFISRNLNMLKKFL